MRRHVKLTVLMRRASKPADRVDEVRESEPANRVDGEENRIKAGVNTKHRHDGSRGEV